MDPLASPESRRQSAIAALEGRLHEAPTALEVVFASAGLFAWGEPSAFRSWPGSIPATESTELPSSIEAWSGLLLPGLRSDHGARLVRSVIEAQDACWLLHADLECGSLLREAHESLEGVLHECRTLLLDDEAAALLEEYRDASAMDLLQPGLALSVIRHPLGETQREALALDPALEVPPVTAICPVPSLARELVFDGGRPSPRMIDNFQKRQGRILCADGSQAGIRALLESDWRVSVEFDAEQGWCDRIDSVRIGVLSASSLDGDRDTWVVSLDPFGLDTQTRLVGQPIVVALAGGERFSL